MGQKVNPLCFRLGVTQRHRSQWFAKKINYSQLVMEDHFLRKLITEQFSKAGILSVSIDRRGEKLHIEMVVTQPRVLTLYGGQNLEKLREEWSKKIARRREQSQKFNSELSGEVVELSLQVTKIKNPTTSAPSIATSLSKSTGRANTISTGNEVCSETCYRRASKRNKNPGVGSLKRC